MATKSQETFVVKIDRKTSVGQDLYIAIPGQIYNTTPHLGNARTWTTFAGAQRWINSTGWAGHATVEQRLGVWV